MSPRLSRLCKPEAGLTKKPKAGLRSLGLVLLATRFLSTCPCHRHDVRRVTSFFQEPDLILRTSCTQGLPANYTSPQLQLGSLMSISWKKTREHSEVCTCLSTSLGFSCGLIMEELVAIYCMTEIEISIHAYITP